MEEEMKKQVAVIGAGNIGKLTTRLLQKKYQVTVYDIDIDKAREAGGGGNHGQVDIALTGNLHSVLEDKNIVVSCCPYFCNERIAKAAIELNLSYCDLSEDAATGMVIERMCDDVSQYTGSIIPHCGLAPGAVQIIAHNMVEQYEPNSLFIRVGALPENPTNALKYNLTWSTNGLVNEYGNPCESIINGTLSEVQPLEGYEFVTIEGIEYEAFNTSGGLGTLARSLVSKVRELNYKTLRYPGHRNLMKFLMTELQLNQRREMLEDILEYAIPTTDEDRVVILVFAVSKTGHLLKQHTYSKTIYHGYISGRHWTAIQIATASSVATVVDLCLQGKIKEGFVRQEEISYDEFIHSDFGSVYKY